MIIKSYIDNLIDPRGWVEWIESANKSARPGAVTKGRVTWASVSTNPNIASTFTVRNFISGDQWIFVNIPHYLDLS
uniref:Pectinesterase catalytic domain-containing protein n=1 Tax=Solanum lycopersicum TaxID=4081 RepID=A0A3Q7IXS8_SOLLC